MIKSELIQKIAAANPHLYHRDVERIVNVIFGEIVDALARGETVKISSFGSFSVRQKGRRIGRNPKTGEEVPILPRKVLVFRASHVLKNKINRALSKAAGAAKSAAGAPSSPGSPVGWRSPTCWRSR